jgi:hypothetical protein
MPVARPITKIGTMYSQTITTWMAIIVDMIRKSTDQPVILRCTRGQAGDPNRSC